MKRKVRDGKTKQDIGRQTHKKILYNKESVIHRWKVKRGSERENIRGIRRQRDKKTFFFPRIVYMEAKQLSATIFFPQKQIKNWRKKSKEMGRKSKIRRRRIRTQMHTK